MRATSSGELSTAELVHVVVECGKLAFADRDAAYGDAEEVPLHTLLSAEYNDARRALVTEEASAEYGPGVGRLPGLHAVEATVGSGEPGRGTVHLDIADRFGNMISATPSGGWLQSSPVIPALGWPLGTRAQMFWLEEGLASSLKPGTRPRTTLSPGLALRDGAPHLAWGTPGGDQQEQWALHAFIRHVDLGLNLQAAIDAPEFHSDHLISSFFPRGFVSRSLALESRFDSRTVRDLQRRGHDVSVWPAWSAGRVSAVAREPDGLLRAGANPRGMQGYAVGAVTERTRTYSWEDPLALRDAMAGRSGLELMQMMARGELPPPPIANTLGFRLVEAERGHAVFECEPAEYHYNPIGVVHAGLAMTLMDSAMGLAFVTTLDEPVGWTTLEVKANFTRALTADTGTVRCTGSVVHGGRRVATTESRIEDRRQALRARHEHDPRPRWLIAYAETVRRDGNGSSLSPVAGRRRGSACCRAPRLLLSRLPHDGFALRTGRRRRRAGRRPGRPRASTPQAPAHGDETFVVMHPPPNISGSLTIGHVLQLSLEDTLVRWHRMRGFDTLFQPGYDHAGISTWAAMGEHLQRKGRANATSDARGSTRTCRTGSRATAGRSWLSSGASAPRWTRRARASRWTTTTTGRSSAGSSTSTGAAGSTATTGYRTGARAIERRCPTSSSSRRRSTTRSRTSGTRSPTVRATSRSRPCGRRRSWPTSPWQCTRRTSATEVSSARRRSCRSSSAGCQ